MRELLLYSCRPQSPSWQFYASLLARMDGGSGVRVRSVEGGDRAPDFGSADVALLFGSNFDLQALRQRHPNVLIGHLEPRAAQGNATDKYDFVVVNSIEAADYFAAPGQAVFIYPTFPVMQPSEGSGGRGSAAERPLRIGYHGNKIHLDAMFPRITDALSRLSDAMAIEFWAMYNMRELGRWRAKGLEKVEVKHIQYDPDNYTRYMAHVDIGVVPQLIPVRRSRFLRWAVGSPFSHFNERHDNFLLRFKETTNNGRAFVFAQYGIPIVADMAPSSCALLGENEYGYVAHSTNQWFNALNGLARDSDLRKKMGVALRKRYEALAEPGDVNRRFAHFILGLADQFGAMLQPVAY